MLPALIAAKGLGSRRVYFPYDPLIPLHMLEGLECIVIRHIQEVLLHLEGQVLLPLAECIKTWNPLLHIFIPISERLLSYHWS